MSKKIFLTGGTGLLGRRLARKLVEQGHAVHLLVRGQEMKPKGLEFPEIIPFLGYLEDEDSLKRALEGCDEMYHLAAYAKVWAPDPTIFEKINYHSALNLVKLAKESGVKKAVLTSTGGVMGHSRNGQPIHENQEGDPAMMTAYERSKIRLEKALKKERDEEMSVVVVNPTRVFGPGPIPLNDSNGEVKVMHLYIQGKLRFLPGDGSSLGSYAYLDDVVDGHIRAMEKGRAGERYILGGENVSFEEFFDLVGKISGKTYRMFKTPLSLLMAFSKMQLFMAERFGRYPLITPELVRKYTKDWHFSSEKAQKELGYTFRPLEESITLSYEWLKRENLL